MLTFSFMAEGDDMSEKLKKLKKNCQITFIKSGNQAAQPRLEVIQLPARWKDSSCSSAGKFSMRQSLS